MHTTKKPVKLALSGVLTGAVNGLFGGGGGMVAVPVFKNLLGYEEKRAHATAILVVAPMCAASALVYIFFGSFNANLVVPVALGSVLGGFAGAKLLKFLPDAAIKIIFALLMVVAGARMLF